MKKSMFFGTLLAAVLLSLVTGPGLVARAQPDQAAASRAVNPATSPWFVSWVDRSTSSDVGAYPSVAYNPSDGLPYISYYDAVNGHLLLASPAVPGGTGNCGTGLNWWCRVVDGNGANGSSLDNVGRYSSIDFWSGVDEGTPVWKLGIAYHDDTTNALKYAVWTQQNPSFGNWDFVTIASTISPVQVIGLHTSLKYDSTGKPRIAYQNTFGSTGSLEFAYWVGSGGNCGEGDHLNTWHCDSIQSGLLLGQDISLAMDYNDFFSIAYHAHGSGELRYAYYHGPSGGTCGSGEYDCVVIDGSSAADVGQSAALTGRRSAADPHRIAYYDRTNGKLKYAFQTGSNANCGEGKWFCGIVDSIGANISIVGLSMALDKNGYPIIAYEDAMGQSSTLNIARPYFAVDLGWGNCGGTFPGYLFTYWQCDTIDNAAYGVGSVNVGQYTSVAVGPGGLGTIVYYEKDSFDSMNSLKVASQRFQTFLPLTIK